MGLLHAAPRASDTVWLPWKPPGAKSNLMPVTTRRLLIHLLPVTGRIPRDVRTGVPAVPQGPFPARAGLPLASTNPRKDSIHRARKSQAHPTPPPQPQGSREREAWNRLPAPVHVPPTLFWVQSQMSFALFPSIPGLLLPPRSPASLHLSWSPPL